MLIAGANSKIRSADFLCMLVLKLYVGVKIGKFGVNKLELVHVFVMISAIVELDCITLFTLTFEVLFQSPLRESGIYISADHVNLNFIL